MADGAVVEAEQALLGALLLSGEEALRPIAEHLTILHFYQEQHRAIYGAMLNLLDRGDPVDLVLVKQELREKGHLSLVPEAMVEALAAAPPVMGNAKAYAAIVYREARWRERRRRARLQLEAIDARDESLWRQAALA